MMSRSGRRKWGTTSRATCEAEKILSDQFKEEELAGRMMPLLEAEAKRRYPDQSLRVAAQGILEKPDGGHRIIT